MGKMGPERRREQSRELRKMENSGNEAKKWLKTKENRFLYAANYERFARNLAQIKH